MKMKSDENWRIYEPKTITCRGDPKLLIGNVYKFVRFCFFACIFSVHLIKITVVPFVPHIHLPLPQLKQSKFKTIFPEHQQTRQLMHALATFRPPWSHEGNNAMKQNVCKCFIRGKILALHNLQKQSG